MGNLESEDYPVGGISTAMSLFKQTFTELVEDACKEQSGVVKCFITGKISLERAVVSIYAASLEPLGFELTSELKTEMELHLKSKLSC